jgi:hypothetical protein
MKKIKRKSSPCDAAQGRHARRQESHTPVAAICVAMCVRFYYCRTYYKSVRVGGGGEWRTCAMRDDEPRPVWMSLLITCR